jgi:GTP:adenosylcobinamide-phosphate guanylyltransferase
MAPKNTTRRAGRGLVSRVYAPVNHFLQATGASVSAVTNTARNVVRKSINTVNKIGKSFTSHTNMAIRNIISRRRQNARRAERRTERRSTRRSTRRVNRK